MAQPVATVTVKMADVEPIAGFITRVCKAESLLRSMTKDEVAALPGKAAHAMVELQSAIRDLGVAQQAEVASAQDDDPSLARFSGDHVPGTRPQRY